MKDKEWWKDKREVLMRIDILGGQLRTFPDKIVDDWIGKKLNIIGKAIEILCYCLRLIEDGNNEALDNVKEEDVAWYKMAMAYWKEGK